MREYETVFVLHPQVDETGIEKQIEGIRQTIEQGEGEVTGVYKWGRRKLAYPIRKVNEGFYTLVRFRSEPAVLRELDRRYKINESILRHLTMHAVGEPNPPDYRSRERRGERRRGRPPLSGRPAEDAPPGEAKEKEPEKTAAAVPEGKPEAAGIAAAAPAAPQGEPEAAGVPPAPTSPEPETPAPVPAEPEAAGGGTEKTE